MTSDREHDDSEIRIFTCFCGKGWKSCSKKMLARCAVLSCSNTTNLQEILHYMPYRFMEMIVLKRLKKRTKGWLDFVKAKRAKVIAGKCSVICSIKHLIQTR